MRTVLSGPHIKQIPSIHWTLAWVRKYLLKTPLITVLEAYNWKKTVNKAIFIDVLLKIHSKTINLSTSLRGINPRNSVFIPRGLVLGSIVLGWILIYRNWSIGSYVSHLLACRHQNQVFHQKGLGLELGLGLWLIIHQEKKLYFFIQKLFWTVFTQVLKTNWFYIITLHNWLYKHLRRFFIQSEVRPKPIPVRLHTFSRAWPQLHVFTSSCDLFKGFMSFVFG